ncbi:DUF2252 domain-containing protein [Oleiagrimonas soli]|uniref:Uncharacterized protein (DUF2252 family) n=1 Tax=Oleiagrimonas soli TaxID=1543381 RepID=A0A099CSR9_9GAMM|nr:DUF2252 domain-containing protein [Oleiagrimonas soli]KGI76741.1 hypothetical protein LF63_0114410 [Oleiagrimonas soli]MBB6185022.1 uncharacterized protein (DUF2252 family) [Oleiagrimonas soli]
MKRLAWTLLGSLALCAAAHAAAPRSNYVVQDIYDANHPYAAQLPQELATKMQKMSADPFAFYRGTADLFYRDVASRSSAYVNAATSQVWLDGDAHLQNFGAFRDSHGNDVFALNDFDEGYFGPYVWDVWREAVGIQLAAEQMGIGASDRDAIVDTFVEAYLDKMTDFKGNDDELGYQLTTSNTSGAVKDLIQAVGDDSRNHMLDKYTEIDNGMRRFQTTDKLATVDSSRYAAIAASIGAYVDSIPASRRYASSFYAVKDIRAKLGSGIGSLGRYRYWVLVEGPSASNSDDVILEMKQAASSDVALANPGGMPSSAYDGQQGYRVVRSLKAQLIHADVLAGYTTLGGNPFYVHEKSPYQEDFDYTQLTSVGQWETAAGYMGKALASAHALSDKDYDDTLIPYSEDKEVADITDHHHDAFRAEVRAFADDYAQQVKDDYQSFLDAYDSGMPLY